VLVLLLWVASCTLWKNFDTDLMRAKTIATCCNFAPAMLKPLVKLSLLGSNAENEEVKKRTKTAACWVLCAYIRAAPEFAQDLFLLYAQDNPLYEPSRRINVEQEFSPSVLWALSRVCQSSVAVNELKSSGRLKYWIQQASYHCQSHQFYFSYI
jgi:hypothetical protein